MSHLPGMAYRCRNDPDRTMEVVSEGAQPLTGHEPSELLATGGVRFTDLVHPEDRQRVREEVQRAIRDSTPFELTYRIRTRNGEERWVWEQGRSVGLGEVGVVAIESFVTDITERKHLEHQLAEGRRMESVGRLAGGIAHDFNNLLSVILGSLELVGDDLPEGDPLHKDLADIRKAGERAASLTRQLLAFSRGQVEIESQVGEGTTVRVRLPALPRSIRQEEESPSISETAPTTVPADAENQTVLVVEDEESVAWVPVRLLERMEFAVLRASGGEEALALPPPASSSPLGIRTTCSSDMGSGPRALLSSPNPTRSKN